MELTINLPDAVFQQLRTIAELTEQPLSDLVLQSIAGNLPPSIASAPTEVRAELLQMQTLSTENLRQIAQAQVPADQQSEHFELLDKNKSGSLTEAEQRRLHELRNLADQLMLKKAHACAILRWRGKPIRRIAQLLKICS
ncbi:MAG: hypothetical protein HLUCCA11_16785 [Phormidesmis priestleyi Ana]|uniref:EF-hand domain-containing protein n=1 Tax=Phormidesmis priestleyi Ana TaxID=1666911 RepID=A0A0P8BYC0_9CYAN|nr:MAG: hypothetical protein HLUCCA11_16785 [Phormidesmis priestleyi Ana]